MVRSDFGRVALAITALLLVPFVAMRFTDEVNWGLGDFVVAGCLLGGAGVGYVVVARRLDNAAVRTVVAAGIGLILLLVWAQLAVGLI